MPRAYDRARHYLRMGDFVKINGYENEKAFFKIALVEPLAQQTMLFGDAAQGVGPAAHVGALPIESDPDPVVMKFMEPVQELRLVQMRFSIYPTDGVSGAPVDGNYVPAVELQVNSPASERRYGSDKLTPTQMNGIAINPPVGGRDGGRLPLNQVRRFDDQCEVFDLWVLHGYEPAVSVDNSLPFNLGVGGVAVLNFNWYLNVQGRRYILAKPSKVEVDGLMKRKIPYRAITLGGIATVVTEA